jgi:hypothetical protein
VYFHREFTELLAAGGFGHKTPPKQGDYFGFSGTITSESSSCFSSPSCSGVEPLGVLPNPPKLRSWFDSLLQMLEL